MFSVAARLADDQAVADKGARINVPERNLLICNHASRCGPLLACRMGPGL